MMYAAAAADFVIDRKIKNLTSTCITFSQHRNPRHQKKRLESKSKVKLTSPSPQNLDSSRTRMKSYSYRPRTVTCIVLKTILPPFYGTLP